MTSPAQMAANQRNATKSTGPITDEGKQRSSQNAMTHGVFRTSDAVTTGPFAEDPDVVEQQVAAIVRGLRPRDDLERIHARHIAMLYLDLERVAVYKGTSLAATPVRRNSSRTATDTSDTPTSFDADHLMSRLENVLRLSGTVYRQLRMAKAEYDTLQKRVLEKGIVYGGDIEVEPDLNALADAQGQAIVWAARAAYLESEKARQDLEAQVAAFQANDR